jgi:hypothetical protein
MSAGLPQTLSLAVFAFYLSIFGTCRVLPMPPKLLGHPEALQSVRTWTALYGQYLDMIALQGVDSEAAFRVPLTAMHWFISGKPRRAA